MIGYRKLLIVLFIGMIAALVPLNEHQAYVLVVLAISSVAGNAVEHMANGKNPVKAVIDEANSIRSRISAVRSVSDPSQIVPNDIDTTNY